MGIGTTIALLAVSFIGIVFWSAAAALVSNADKAREALGRPQTLTSILMGHLITLTALTVIVAPLFVIIWKAATA